MAELSPIVAELERMRDVLMGEYPNLASTEPPLISITSKGRKRHVTGWYLPALWKDSFEDALAGLSGMLDEGPQRVPVQTRRAEVVIASELVGDPMGAVSELVRQLLQHKYPGTLEVKNGYYSNEWYTYSSFVDHYVGNWDDQPTKGAARWWPRQSFIDRITPLMNMAAWDVSRDADAAREKVGSRMRKWVCGCTVIRSATVVKAKCQSCGLAFMWDEGYPALQAKVGKVVAMQLLVEGRVTGTPPEEE